MRTLCNRLDFPAEATDFLCSAYQKLISDEKAGEKLLLAEDNLFLSDNDEYLTLLQEIADKTQLPRYTVDMLLLLHAAHPLRYLYHQNGYSEEIYWDTLQDLRCKLLECHRMYGIWGTFTSWFRRFYQCTRFKLGRLEFETSTLPEGYRDLVPAGGEVLACHIPSSGPLTPESVLDSLKRAYAFYHKQGVMVVRCSSWMLYPPHRALFPEGSNLRSFYDLFDVFQFAPDENNTNRWRIFYVDKDCDPQQLPQNTTLQKNFARYLQAGNKMGSGLGVLLFDGTKVVK